MIDWNLLLDSHLADLNNTGKPGGGSCTAAAFLKVNYTRGYANFPPVCK